MGIFIESSTLLLALASLVIAAVSLLAFYYQLKKVIDPTRRKKGKAVFTKPLSQAQKKNHHRGIMSSSNSSVSIDLDVAEMD